MLAMQLRVGLGDAVGVGHVVDDGGARAPVRAAAAWERGTAEPAGPARKLLWIVAADRETVSQRTAAE